MIYRQLPYLPLSRHQVTVFSTIYNSRACFGATAKLALTINVMIIFCSKREFARNLRVWNIMGRD